MEAHLDLAREKEIDYSELVNGVVKLFMENGYSIGMSAMRRINCYTDKDGYFGGCKVNVPMIASRCVKMLVFEKRVGDRVVPVIVLVPQPSDACRRAH